MSNLPSKQFLLHNQVPKIHNLAFGLLPVICDEDEQRIDYRMDYLV